MDNVQTGKLIAELRKKQGLDCLLTYPICADRLEVST